jgi:hypothetical protein
MEGPADKVLELLKSLEDRLAQEQTDLTSCIDKIQLSVTALLTLHLPLRIK